MKKVVFCVFASFLFSCAHNEVKKSELNKQYEVEIVEAEGTAPIINGDRESAKKSALSDSMKNALGLVIGVYVSGDTLVSKSILINSDITSKSEGYIEKYKVLKEYVDGDFYKVKIEAHVRKEDITKKIKNLETDVEKIGNPVIYVKILEKIQDRPIEGNYSGGEYISSLRDDGFRIAVDSNSADVLIEGEAKSTYNTNKDLGGFISYACSISLNIATPNGEIIKSIASSAGGIGLTDDVAAKESMIQASRKTYEKVKNSILDYYRQKKIITFKISNVNNLNEVNEVVKYFRNVPIVKEAVLKKFSSDTAVLEVLMRKGNSTELMDVINKNPKFEVLKMSAYDIEMSIKK
jgi:hypothetical protein